MCLGWLWDTWQVQTAVVEHPLSKHGAAVKGVISRSSASRHPWSRSTQQDSKGTETVTALKIPMLNNWEGWGMRLLTWKTSWDEEMSDFCREEGFPEG